MSRLQGYRFLLVLVLSLKVTLTFGTEIESQSSSDSAEFVVAGYLPNYRSYINVNNTALLLTDLILFSVEPDSNGNLNGCCLDTSHYQLAQDARTHKKQVSSIPLRLWVSIGGAGRSESLSTLLSNPSLTRILIQNLIALCHTHQLDGVDWNGNVAVTDTHNDDTIPLFLVDLAHALHQQNLFLSITTRHLLPPTVVAAVDRIQFMAYDLLSNQGGSPNQNQNHANIHIISQMLNHWINTRHYPPAKIVLGIPAYARHGTTPGNVKTFAEMVDDGMNIQKKEGKWKGYLFDSVHNVQTKVKYAKEMGLKGVFLWELGQDKQDENGAPSGWLLTAAAIVAGNPIHNFQMKEEL